MCSFSIHRSVRCLLIALFAMLSQSAAGQDKVDFNQLAHPDVAKDLELSDSQRATIQKLLQLRAEAAAIQEAAKKAEQLKSIDKQIQEVLSDDQRDAWSKRTEHRRLKFQFSEQKWDEVLSWFAKQEGLTLVMDRIPPGSFTYRDTKSYSPAEAIDLLNSVLMTRGYTLIRREKMLLVLELNDSIPLELIPRIALEELPSRGRFEIVSVMFPLGKRPVSTVIQEIKPFLGSFGRSLPLEQSRQLLVVETAGKMQTINVLIASIPEASSPVVVSSAAAAVEPVFAAYPLGKLDPQSTLKTIRSLVNSERVTVDETTHILSAYLTPAQHLAVKSAIDQMQEQPAVNDVPQSIAYPIGNSTIDGLLKQITAVAPRAIATPDTVGGRILVTGYTAEHERISSALKALGVGPGAAERNVQVFQVGVGQATIAATAIRSMIPNGQVLPNETFGTLVVRGEESDLKLVEEVVRRWKSTGEAGPTVEAFPLDRPTTDAWLVMVKSVIPTAKAWLDPSGKRLMVLGTAEERKLLGGMLPQLLTALPELHERKLKVYSISGTQSDRLLQVKTALADKLKDVKLIESTRPGELLVWATDLDHTWFAEFLQQIEQGIPETKLRWPKMYRVSVLDPKLTVEVLRERFTSAKISSDETTGSVTVWTDAETHNAINELLNSLEKELPQRQPAELKRYDFPKESFIQLTAIKADLEKRLAPIQLTLDSTNGVLWAWGAPMLQEQLANQLEPLKTPPAVEQQRVLMAYILQNADATSIKTLLDQVLKDATIVADAKRRQIVATATLRDHARLKATIEQLDQPLAARPEELRSYEMKGVQAASVLPTLQSLWPRLTLSADTTSNRIIASGSVADQEQLQAALERFRNAPQGEPLEVKTFTVTSGEMTTLPALLSQIAPQAVISSDPVSRTVIVWGTAQQHERVSAALDQLSQAAEARQEVKAYKLTPARAAAMRTSLITLFPTASVAVDVTSGQVIVLATKTLHKKIEEVIEKANDAGDDVMQRVPRRYEVPLSLRPTLPTLLTTAMPSVTVVTPPSDTKSPFVVLATTREHEQLAKMFDELKAEWSDEKSDRVLRVYALSRVDTAAFQQLVADQRPLAKIVAGTGTSKIVVADTEEGHTLLKQSLVDLEKAYETPAAIQVKVFPLKFGEPTAAYRVLNTLLPKASIAVDTQGRTLAVTATADEHRQVEEFLKGYDVERATTLETRGYSLKNRDPTSLQRALTSSYPKAVFGSDAVNGTLIVSAAPEEHKQIEGVIEKLNATPPAKTSTLETFRIKFADVRLTAVALQQAMARRSGVGVSFDEATGSVFVVGSADDVDIAKRFIEQVDQERLPEEPRRFRMFPLSGVDGNAVVESIRNLLRHSHPPIDIRYDFEQRRLVVIGTLAQMKSVEDTLQQFQRPERQLEIFTLKSLDINHVRNAINSMFSDDASSQAPALSVDEGTQQLMIRATSEQLTKIRELLKRMGETGSSPDATSKGAGRVRTIPVGRSSDQLLEEIQKVWPALRRNRIEVIRAKEQERPAVPIPPPPQNDPGCGDTPQVPAAATTPVDDAKNDKTKRDVDGKDAGQGDVAPPIIVLPSARRWTIASDDVEALDQFEKLVTASLVEPATPAASTGNYSIYLLRHAGADDIEQVLSSVFKSGNSSGSTSFSFGSSFDGGVGRVRIVADTRINAIVVYGSRADRAVLEELLAILDSDDLIEAVQTPVPKLIPIKNSEAKRVLEIVRDVYRAQLSSGGGRRPLTIPEGVSSEVASTIQQINAASTGPLMTIGLDASSNSLILRAPANLAKEISDFINDLDLQATKRPANRVQIIRLEQLNATKLQKTLDSLLNTRGKK